ncbi:recombination-associated protein RdgC [Chromobacterium violaceum]|uniref:Recombination-associated protein RdgC n=1 Tax=Chromobacterium violaceum TaxID=536 RepID=A0A202BDK6_CHRVL|nr:recombination-associated protein RdgC [Chromobacterium violaceum]OVE49421.1 recombination-associated protein RdgC [Chromobacterium violaceum]
MVWFNNASIYRLGEQSMEAKLAEALSKRPFTPCAGLDWFSEGWVVPAAHLDSVVYASRGRLLVRLKRDDKVLPGTVIRDSVEEKVKEIEDKEMRKVGRKEKLALKEQITDDLLPRAFTKSSCVSAFMSGNWLIADTSSTPRAEALVSKLREALPPFPAALPRTRIAPHTAMTDWLAAGKAPGGFELDADAVLRDGSENGAEVRVSRIDLTSDEIRQHIATGKQVTKLGLIWNEKIRFQLTDTLQLKRIQFRDMLQDEASQAGDDRESLFEATFILMSEELGELVEALVEALGGLEESQTAAPVPETTEAEEVPWTI